MQDIFRSVVPLHHVKRHRARAGYMYDISPTDELTSLSIPDVNRHWFLVGGTYNFWLPVLLTLVSDLSSENHKILTKSLTTIRNEFQP
ncbi:outer membrane protein transport protein [Vibrio lentus]|nr:outer membrane protein transport protein [Vibrio lentus]